MLYIKMLFSTISCAGHLGYRTITATTTTTYSTVNRTVTHRHKYFLKYEREREQCGMLPLSYDAANMSDCVFI